MKLKPCPFCGNEAFVKKTSMTDRWSVGCSKCEWRRNSFYTTKSEAVKSWNNRTSMGEK